jgi:Cu/Ag efflux protein CusF
MVPLMPKPLSLCILVLGLLPLAACGAEKPATPPASGADAKAARHPLKGVVTGVMAERSSLVVKHEEVPGVMRAMTMMFKVDAAALKAVKEGDAITAQMARESDGWWLHDVKPAAASPAPGKK